ncbi:hypothetical protein [Streptomyces sp. NPDC002346]
MDIPGFPDIRPGDWLVGLLDGHRVPLARVVDVWATSTSVLRVQTHLQDWPTGHPLIMTYLRGDDVDVIRL